MLHGFPKVGCRERIILEKRGVLSTEILEICILRAEIFTKTFCNFFLKIENSKMGVGHMSGALMVNW